MARADMFREGVFVLVFNRATVLGLYETSNDALDGAEQHACGTVRGQYDVFKLGAPIITGKNGVAVDWGAPSKRPELEEGK
jgi:hypothetical protein